MPRKTIFIVLGMHRSGTSAMMGSLRILGIPTGGKLLPAQDDNPQGFWEQADIVATHEQILAALGSYWHDVLPLPTNWWLRKDIQPFRQKLIGIVEGELEGSLFWGVKDPRMCRLIPLWSDIFSHLSCLPVFVNMIRHPLEVGDSLAHRDGFSEEKSWWLWLNHILDVEQHTQGHKHAWIRFEDLLSSTTDLFEQLKDHFNIEFPHPPSSVQQQLEQYLNPDSRHHQDRYMDECRVEQVKVYADVYELIHGFELDKMALKKLSELRKRTQQSTYFLGPLINQFRTHNQELLAEIDRARDAHHARDLREASMKTKFDERALEVEMFINLAKPHIVPTQDAIDTTTALILFEESIKNSQNQRLEVETLQGQVGLLSQKLDDEHQSLLKSLSENRELLERETQALKTALTGRNDLLEVKEQLHALELNNNTLTQKFEHGQALHNDVTQANLDLKTIIDQREQVIEDLQRTVASKIDGIHVAQEQRTHLKHELEQEKRHVEQLTIDLSRVNDTVKNLKHDLTTSTAQADQLSGEINEASAKLDRLILTIGNYRAPLLEDMQTSHPINSKTENLAAQIDHAAARFDEKMSHLSLAINHERSHNQSLIIQIRQESQKLTEDLARLTDKFNEDRNEWRYKLTHPIRSFSKKTESGASDK